MRINHDIFNSPNRVELSLESLPTPSDYGRENLGPTMPMWRVQTDGYTEGTGQLIGVVSRDRGFLDSPDTEWISGGINSKNSRAVAIGRHGNFLHWGFAASPSFLTKEAKLVFVNAVHYIAKFAGRAPIARKRSGTAMRSHVVDALAVMGEVGHREALARHAESVKELAERKASIQARIDAKEDVAKMDKEWLSIDAPPVPDRFDRIRRYVPEVDWPGLKNDPVAIRKYFADRLPYYRSEG